jgi:hypothetical protein
MVSSRRRSPVAAITISHPLYGIVKDCESAMTLEATDESAASLP